MNDVVTAQIPISYGTLRRRSSTRPARVYCLKLARETERSEHVSVEGTCRPCDFCGEINEKGVICSYE